MSQLAEDSSLLHTKRSNHHYCCFRNASRHQSKHSLKVGCRFPLTEEATEVICKFLRPREPRVVIDGPRSLPTSMLPNLVEIHVEYDHGHGWLQGFRGATLGNLTSVAFYPGSHLTNDFLEVFESVVLTTSIPTTLSKFMFLTAHAWRPNHRSLLPFGQLEVFTVGSSCGHDCTSMIDDDVITDLARVMSQLESIWFGNLPCKTPTGVTAKGLAALAYHCPHL